MKTYIDFRFLFIVYYYCKVSLIDWISHKEKFSKNNNQSLNKQMKDTINRTDITNIL